MRKGVFVYISGPMTARNGRSIEDNVAAGVKVYFDLLARGIPCFCPHLSGAFPTAWTVLPHETWLQYDYAVIDRCTHVLMIDGWMSSAGARQEKAYAESIGIPVLLDVAQLEEAAVMAR